MHSLRCLSLLLALAFAPLALAEDKASDDAAVKQSLTELKASLERLLERVSSNAESSGAVTTEWIKEKLTEIDTQLKEKSETKVAAAIRSIGQALDKIAATGDGAKAPKATK